MTKEAPKDARKTIFARVQPRTYKKLQRIAAKRSSQRGEKVTLQDVVIELIEGAS